MVNHETIYKSYHDLLDYLLERELESMEHVRNATEAKAYAIASHYRVVALVYGDIRTIFQFMAEDFGIDDVMTDEEYMACTAGLSSCLDEEPFE